MPNDFFAFKQFTINQSQCAMKVNTDGVLLGAWVIPNGSKKILDIGTGTGVIALMLAQKSEATITAIEIDKDSAQQADENFKSSKFYNQLNLINVSFQAYAKQTNEKFNLIVTNPPYFVDSLASIQPNKAIAKHNYALPFDELIDNVKLVLEVKGKFCVILPKNEAEQFRELAKQKGLYLSKLLRVKTKQESESEKRHLMQFEYRETEFSEAALVIEKEKRHEYTDEYINLTKDYYLHF